jgi:hypothetical protein
MNVLIAKKKMIKYNPYKNNMYMHRMLMRIRQNPSFKNVFKIDLTKAIIEDLKLITNPKHLFRQNTIINLSGETGSGKSISMISLGVDIFKNFSEKNIFFYDQEILNNAHKFPQDSFLIRDENPQKSIFGIGSNRTSSQIDVLAETCRKAGLNLGFVEPEFIQTGITKLILETVDMDVDRRLTRLAVRDTRTLDYMGAIYIKVVDEDNKIWIRYNKVKDAFIDDIKKGVLSKSKLNPKNIAKKIYEEIDLNIYKTKKERKIYIIDKFPNYTTGEIDLISTNLEIMLRKDGMEKV